jgi:phage major head subunit gpT-like protein
MKMFKPVLLVAVAALAWMIGPAFAAPLLNSPCPWLMALQGDLPTILFGGLLVNAATLSTLFTGLKTLFNKALVAKPGDWAMTAMVVPSTGAGEDYAWLTRFPRFRKWIGDKVVKNIEAGKYYKANEDWETTISVKRNDIEDDRLGLYNTQALGAGEAAGELNDIIVDDLKNGAFTQTC